RRLLSHRDLGHQARVHQKLATYRGGTPIPALDLLSCLSVERAPGVARMPGRGLRAPAAKKLSFWPPENLAWGSRGTSEQGRAHPAVDARLRRAEDRLP